MHYVLVLEIDAESRVVPACDGRLSHCRVAGLRSAKTFFHGAHVRTPRGHFHRRGTHLDLVIYYHGLGRQGRGGYQQHQGQRELHDADYNSWDAPGQTGGGPLCRNVNCVAVWPAHD